jgi:hypothetical protein
MGAWGAGVEWLGEQKSTKSLRSGHGRRAGCGLRVDRGLGACRVRRDFLPVEEACWCTDAISRASLTRKWTLLLRFIELSRQGHRAFSHALQHRAVSATGAHVDFGSRDAEP